MANIIALWGIFACVATALGVIIYYAIKQRRS